MCGFLALALLPAASLSENGFLDSCKSRDTPEGSNYAETRQKKNRIDVLQRKERSIVCKGRG
jgi:hypothetical protein